MILAAGSRPDLLPLYVSPMELRAIAESWVRPLFERSNRQIQM